MAFSSTSRGTSRNSASNVPTATVGHSTRFTTSASVFSGTTASVPAARMRARCRSRWQPRAALAAAPRTPPRARPRTPKRPHLERAGREEPVSERDATCGESGEADGHDRLAEEREQPADRSREPRVPAPPPHRLRPREALDDVREQRGQDVFGGRALLLDDREYVGARLVLDCDEVARPRRPCRARSPRRPWWALPSASNAALSAGPLWRSVRSLCMSASSRTESTRRLGEPNVSIVGVREPRVIEACVASAFSCSSAAYSGVEGISSVPISRNEVAAHDASPAPGPTDGFRSTPASPALLRLVFGGRRHELHVRRTTSLGQRAHPQDVALPLGD